MQYKILIQLHESNCSGANIAMLEYIDALKESFVFHVILPHSGSMQAELNNRNITSFVVQQYMWTGQFKTFQFKNKLRRIFRNEIALINIKRIIRNEKYHAVFTNTIVPYLSAKAAFQLKVSHVWWIHEFGEEDFGIQIGDGNPNIAHKKMQKWSQLIICNSKSVAKKYQVLLPLIKVQYNYQPVSWNTSLEEYKNTVRKGYLMFGQITETKGHFVVLEALVKAKKKGVNIQLTIKGPCEQPDYLKLLKKFIQVNQLEFYVTIEIGFFSKEKVMPQFEALIVASRSEAFGRVIIESNKAGLKVLVKKSGGAPELINETNGLLFENEKELLDIFLGKRDFPSGPITLPYNEQLEIESCRNLITAIL